MVDMPKGAILQRDGETYAIIPNLKAGVLDAETLAKITEVVKKYNIPIVKCTAAMRLALVGIKAEDVESIWNDLGLEPAHAVGKVVRSVQACPGTSVCRYGKQNSLGLAEQLENEFAGRELPNKFKMGVSGCPLSCAESFIRDLGFIGKPDGWMIIVGGFSAGIKPRIGDVLTDGLTNADALGISQKIIDKYQEVAKPGERFGRTIERIGIAEFKKMVLNN